MEWTPKATIKNQAELEKLIPKYVCGMDPSRLGMERPLKFEGIERLGIGTRHFNYAVIINRKRFNMRFCTSEEPEKRIEYEYKALKVLNRYGVAPRAYTMEPSNDKLGLPFMITEYVEGRHIDRIDDSLVGMLASEIARINSIRVNEEAYSMLHRIERKEDLLSEINKKMDHIGQLLSKSKEGRMVIDGLSDAFAVVSGIDIGKGAAAITHTDIATPNIIVSSQGIRLIDWESVCISDPAYGISCMIDREGMDSSQLSLFLNGYFKIREDETIPGRLKAFRMIRAFDRLCWAVWESFDIKSGAAKESLFHDSRNPSNYINMAKRKFAECKSLGIVPADERWGSMLGSALG
jgi:thiamine kinase-like enzyme